MDFLSLEEAAKELDVSMNQMRYLIDFGKVPFSKISGRLKVERQELDKFLVSCRCVTAEQAVAARSITVRERRLQLEKERRAQAQNHAPEEGARAA